VTTQKQIPAIIIATRPRFPLGQLVITANALERLTPAEIEKGVSRHASGDWGDLVPDDVESNEEGLIRGERLLSAYGMGDRRFWIITESDRSVTTILLPEDY
jgi:hypothetical protein